MPSSRPNAIPTVIHLLRQLKPQSILDVGIGFGKWGHLFREYTDIVEAEHEPARYQREHWRVHIDGIEGHPAYLTPMHRFLYNEIHVGDAGALLKTLPDYDLIFLGDVLEHFEKTAGAELLRDAWARARKAVVLCTPKFETEQGALCGNELERHRSLWSAKDFDPFPGARVTTVDEATLLVVWPKRGVPELECTPPRPPRPEDAERLRLACAEIRSLVPAAEPFILVDQEQLSGTLAGLQARPFLESNGVYWGPPGNDAEAIRELERMRDSGARCVVFIWSTFWWLTHYAEFARHLRTRYRCLRESDAVIVFQLEVAYERSARSSNSAAPSP